MDPKQIGIETTAQDDEWGIDPDFNTNTDLVEGFNMGSGTDPMMKDAPGCLLYDPTTKEYKALHPFKQSNKIIEDEFLDMSFLDKYTATSLLEDGGVIKYTDPTFKTAQNEPIKDITNGKKKGNKEDPKLPPEPQARVRVRYEGRKDNGELLDKLRDRKQLKAFKLHSDDVIPGMHHAVASLRRGETAWFKFLPEYHYGQEGVPHLIGPEAVLYYKIELADFTNMKKVLANDDYEGRIAIIAESREKGNEAFAKKEYDKAYKEYKKGSETVKNTPKTLMAILTEEQKAVLNDFQVKIANNASLVCIKKKNYKEGLDFAELVLKIAPTNSKALFRKGQCLIELDNIEVARKCFEESMKNDEEAKTECEKYIERIERIKSQRLKNEKRRFEHVFKNLLLEEEKEQNEKKIQEKTERKKEREQRRKEDDLNEGVIKKVKTEIAMGMNESVPPLFEAERRDGKEEAKVENLVSPVKS